ncbi:MAG TPA: tetratricopeptide repeat protein [Chloroflexia bacterium]|jgi:tetratricopeptide (TPR) repeat protein
MDRMSIDNVKSDRDTFVGSTVTQNIYGTVTPSITSLHQLRDPVDKFVGRQDEIEQLVRTMRQATESGKVAIGGIRGMGGVGKTELAYAVAQRLVDTYPDAQLALELRGAIGKPMTPEQALQTIIRAFEPGMQLPDSLNALRSVYTSLLTGKRVLILADDVRDKRQVEPLLPPPGCALLLTSRYRFSLSGMEMETLDLEILPQPDAEKLLLEISPDIGPAAPRMAQLCGRLPLALRICASMCDIEDSTLTIEDHVKALEDERARLVYMQDPDAQDHNDPATSVEASLQLSYSSLDPQMQQVLCQLSVFPTDFDRDAARAVVHVQAPETEGKGTNASHQPVPVERWLEFLYRRSLVEWDRETRRYSLHDLVRVFGSERLEGEYAVRIRHAQYYARIAAHVDDLIRRGGQNILTALKMFDQERTNIDTGWNWVQEQAGEDASSTSDEIDVLLLDYVFSTIYVGDLRYYNRRERITQFEAAVDAARRLSRRAVEDRALNNLGMAYLDLGEPRKAIQYFEQALEITRETNHRQGEGIALGGLGIANIDLGEPRKAIQYLDRVLEISREIDDPLDDPLDEGIALVNLGMAYLDLGEPRKAIQYFDRVLEISREIDDPLDEGIALVNLGRAYVDLGEPRKAIQYFEQALEITCEIDNPLGEGAALLQLGTAYKNLGEPRKAIQYYEQALETAHQMGHRWSEGAVLGNLGMAYVDLGEPRKAVQYFEQALEISRETEARQGAGNSSWNLGLLLAEEGEVARAVELMQVKVNYEREIGHADAEKHAAEVEELRKRLP